MPKKKRASAFSKLPKSRQEKVARSARMKASKMDMTDIVLRTEIGGKLTGKKNLTGATKRKLGQPGTFGTKKGGSVKRMRRKKR
jgi:hypothetical protein